MRRDNHRASVDPTALSTEDDVVARAARANELVTSSVARVVRGQARMVSAVRRGLFLRGGTFESDVEPAEPRRKRIRELLQWSVEPMISRSASVNGARCRVCERSILRGATEYEFDFQWVTVSLDTACFRLWQKETAQSA